MSIDSKGATNCGWTLPDDATEVLSHEEWYGFPVNDLSIGRTFVIDNPHYAEIFSNPPDADELEVFPAYFNDNLGEPMFAAGLVHWLYGPSETGKSFDC